MNPPQKQFPISSFSFSFILAALALLSLQPLHAATPSLFNTGVDAAGNPLPNGATDPHWTVVAGPGVPPVTPAAVLAEQYSGTYTQSALSRWVWVNTNGMAATETPYTFRLTFELTVATRSNLVLSGQWAVDNVARILLNGASNGIGSGTLILSNDVPTHFGTFHPFTLTNGFVLGTNTLDFVASDFGGIAGLNVTALNSSNFVVIVPGARLWTGAGGNGLWSNPANWSNNVAPNPNDALIFPGPGGASVNDFPPATIFGAVQITGGAHTFGGAAFTAAGGLLIGTDAGITTISNALTFPPGAGLSNLTFSTATFHGSLNAGAGPLAIESVGNIVLNAALSSSNGLVKTGFSALILNANNPGLLGTNVINAGTLSVAGTATNRTQLNANGGLNGTGTVGPVTAASGSSCAPGNFGPGRLTELGDLALTAGSTFSAVLSGVNNFSQLGVQGAVSLGGATLAVGRNFSPADNTVFLILTNDGPDAIVGTFANLPEGGYVTNGNFAFRISYVGGTGNDITLTSTNISGPPAPTPGPRFWTGAGGNALWSNSANWSNNIAPVTGDTLFFHGAGGASSNDLAASRRYVGVNISGGSWQFAGNGFIATNGITVTNTSGPVDFANDFTLTMVLGLTNHSAQPLRFNGTLALASNPLRVFAGGPVEFNDAISGAGALSKFGPATLALNTNNPAYTGGTTVSAGTLLVNGATTNSALTLGGVGTSVSGTGHLGAFGNASGGGVVSPGGSGTGALLFSGSSTFDNTTTNRLQINGPTPGADYDQIGIRGAVTLGNSRLELAFGYTPPTNTVFLVLTNDLADAITGRFGGLAQNALFTNGNLVLRINYTAGTGNDVAVTVLQILSAPGQPSNITGFHLLTNGLARLGVLGTANASYAIEASTNLPGHWTAVATNTADGAGFFEFIDADTLNFPIRFYRVRSP